LPVTNECGNECFMTRMSLVAIAFVIAPWTAVAAPCPGNPDALGTERVLEVDAKSTPRVGRKQFPSTLPLREKELVLTFDDGPWPGTTPRILDALKNECVRATFFLLGRNTTAHPQIARRALAEGHSIGHHSYSHPLLDRMPMAKAEAEIDRGIAADETAVYGQVRATPTTPFFGSRDLPQIRPCSIAWPSAVSWFSGLTYGPATGSRWDPTRNRGSSSPA